MPFVPFDGVVQAEMVYTWDGEICENVLQYQVSINGMLAAMDELGEALEDWHDTHMKAQQHESCILTHIKLTDLTSAISPALDYTLGMPHVGTLSGESMPNNVSCVFSKRTAYRGRSYRGRIYQIGLGEASTQGNKLGPSQRTSLLAAWQLAKEFTTASGTWTMVVCSRQADGVQLTEGIATPVVNITTDGVIDSQRRRLPGRGS